MNRRNCGAAEMARESNTGNKQQKVELLKSRTGKEHMEVLKDSDCKYEIKKGASALPCLSPSRHFCHGRSSSTTGTEKGVLETVSRKSLPGVWASEGRFYYVSLKSEAFFKRLAISEGRQSILNNRKKGLFRANCSVLRQVVPQLSRVRGRLCLWMAHPRASGIQGCLCTGWRAAVRGRSTYITIDPPTLVRPMFEI